MTKVKELNKLDLLKQLEPVEYVKDKSDKQDLFQQVNLASSLLYLTDIKPEKEYSLCRSLAEHLLEKVPEPDPTELSDD